ncbi:hypothetical protein HAX54_004685, partial [Datura stramonium]|nr:hypothetical protein [Datura stramonium]
LLHCGVCLRLLYLKNLRVNTQPFQQIHQHQTHAALADAYDDHRILRYQLCHTRSRPVGVVVGVDLITVRRLLWSATRSGGGGGRKEISVRSGSRHGIKIEESVVRVECELERQG